MSREERFHKKMVKMILGGVAPIQDEPKSTLASEVHKALKPKLRTITSFFSSGIKELKNDLQKVKSKKKAE